MTALTIVFGLISALGGVGGLSAVAYIAVTRKKIGAEAKKIGADADAVMTGKALEMYDRAGREAREAKKEARACRNELNALRDHVDLLEHLMRDKGMVPPVFRYPPTGEGVQR